MAAPSRKCKPASKDLPVELVDRSRERLPDVANEPVVKRGWRGWVQIPPGCRKRPYAAAGARYDFFALGFLTVLVGVAPLAFFTAAERRDLMRAAALA